MQTQAQETFGGVDIYVSCAARRLYKDFFELTDEDWHYHLNPRRLDPDPPLGRQGGLRTLTKSLASGLGQYGITVNDVSPGFIDTKCAIPQRREPCSGVLRDQPKVNITNNAFSADEPQWDATIFTAPASGRLLDTHKLWAWQLAPSWLPHCRGRWPDSGKQGRAPSLSGPSVPE
jgi:3-oxoacyl-[acyl-carrier protein] reductase